MSSIDIAPTWRNAIQILIMALENGTDRGKQQARAELLAIGDQVDNLLPGNRHAPSIEVAAIWLDTKQLGEVYTDDR
ncbi:MAG: hypothetical protein GY815_07250 [Gammaproteobacteria bacterium]|nr:hypothetical protein [Gammaproteobacteria bacterium]